jgi:hypothetical protein
MALTRSYGTAFAGRNGVIAIMGGANPSVVPDGNFGRARDWIEELIARRTARRLRGFDRDQRQGRQDSRDRGAHLPRSDPRRGQAIRVGSRTGQVMTNATVGTVTKAPEGMVLYLTFKGGDSEYTVGPDVPVLANAPGDISMLKPGAAVFVIALKKPDGNLTSSRIYAEKDGVKPPM